MDVSYFLESAFSRASVLHEQVSQELQVGPESPGTEEHVQTCLKHSWLLFTVWGRSVKYKARSPQMARQRLHSGPPDFGNYGGLLTGFPEVSPFSSLTQTPSRATTAQ